MKIFKKLDLKMMLDSMISRGRSCGYCTTKKTLMLIGYLFLVCVLHSQMIVKIDKGSHTRRNLIESLELPLCFEMEEYIVAAIDAPDVLHINNIQYSVLTPNHYSEPLYIISNDRRSPLRIGNYIGEIVLNEPNMRIEKVSSKNIPFPQQKGIKYIPVEISTRKYKNVSISISENVLSNFSYQQKTDIINSINADSLAWFIQNLEDFETRFAFHPNRFDVSQWIENQFLRMGYTNVLQDSFYTTVYGINSWQTNVVATLTGSVFPERYVIIGAHHDSINGDGNMFETSMIFAPGADDNASGVAAVLEIARVIMANNFTPYSSIRFVTFAQEELGLHGAFHDANKMISENKKVVAMVNSDMIAYTPSENWLFSIRNYPGADFLTTIAQQNSQILGMNTFTTTQMNQNSDSWAYHVVGIPAIFFIEGDFNPYYHSSNDLLVNACPEYTKQFTKLVASVAFIVIDTPDYPDNFVLRDTGTGNSLRAEWQNVNLEEVSYILFVKNTTTGHVTEFQTTENYFDINNLSEGIMYEVTLHSLVNDTLSNGIVRYLEPLKYPRPVVGFEHIPMLKKIQFLWTPNQEIPIAGYKIYRKEISLLEFVEVATVQSESFSWIDTHTEDKVWYEYKITAFYQNGHQSPDSQIIKTRHLSFNNGILIVDLTTNSENSQLLPPLESVKSFFQNIFEGFDFEEIKYTHTNQIKMEDIGAYSTILIHKNSFNNIVSNELEDIIKILIDNGCNIIYTSNDPLRHLNNALQYPLTYNVNSFPRTYFGIETVDNNYVSRFLLAQSSGWQNLPNLELDISKIPEVLNEKLYRLEVFGGNEFEVLYTYFSGSDDPAESAFDGMPVALYTSRGESHIILTSIPLYYIKPSHAKEFVQRALSFFDGNVADNDINIPVSKGLMIKNYPNPFNPTTTIEFSLPNNDFATINIYNIRGQMIKSFEKDFYASGINKIMWDGKDNNDNLQASGIYFYQVKTDSGSNEVKRMVLLK